MSGDWSLLAALAVVGILAIVAGLLSLVGFFVWLVIP